MLGRLLRVLLNDILNERGERKVRHARIGEGCIGLAALTRVVNHPRLRGLPFILETPNDHAGYAREIALLRAARQTSGEAHSACAAGVAGKEGNAV